ncbi:MAG TPA: hypothetical protein VNH11_08430 [Pirellulales bacterium]|nr:hypothetical protein [Pirellulales bacterium]
MPNVKLSQSSQAFVPGIHPQPGGCAHGEGRSFGIQPIGVISEDALAAAQQSPTVATIRRRQFIQVSPAEIVVTGIARATPDSVTLHVEGTIGAAPHNFDVTFALDMPNERLVVTLNQARPAACRGSWTCRTANHPHQLVRVDREDDQPIHRELEDRLLAVIVERLAGCDAVLISDYRKGVCTPRLLKRLISAAARRRIPTLVDPARDVDYGRYHGATLLKPNRLEAQIASGATICSPSDALAAGRLLCERSRVETVLVRGRLVFVQIGAAEHSHPPLDNVVDLRGKTDHRQLIRLVYHSSGVLTGVSYPMHLAAAVPCRPLAPQAEPASPNRQAFHEGRDPTQIPRRSAHGVSGLRLRPCVVINGGREPPHWEQYPGHQFLHTIGRARLLRHRRLLEVARRAARRRRSQRPRSLPSTHWRLSALHVADFAR